MRGQGLDRDALIIRDVASGASLDRPGIEEVRRAQCVMAPAMWCSPTSVDRLARKTNHIGVILYEAEQADVSLEFVKGDFENSPTGRFLLAAVAFVAELERELIIERTVRGKKERARSGRLPQATGKGCYGYTYVPDTGRRDLNPEQAPIVVRIFEQFVAGKGSSRIAEDLNADGVPTFTGKHWSPITVYRTLRRETYTGVTIYRKTGTKMVKRPGRKQPRPRGLRAPESEHIEIPGASPPDRVTRAL